MRFISIRQPWASLIVEGHKDIENRTWPTRYRGLVLIHASLKFDADDRTLRRLEEITGRSFQKMAILRGGVIGVAEIVDCVEWHQSQWFVGPFGFVLRNVKTLPFTETPGNARKLTVPPPMLLRRLGL